MRPPQPDYLHVQSANDRGRFTPPKLRLLFLVPFAPRLDAAHGGGRVIAQFLTNLAPRHQVALCYLRTPEEPSVDPVLQEQCEIVEEVIIPEVSNSGPQRWLHRMRVWTELLTGKPLWAIGRAVTLYGNRVYNLVNSWCPDLIQIEYHIMGQYLSTLKGYPAPRVLVQHEPGKEAAYEAWRDPHARGLIMPFLDLLAWERFERKVVRQVQSVVVFTERDRRTLMKLDQETPIVRIPLGAELPECPLNPIGSHPLSLLFVGNFLHLPNVDAAIRLVKDIFPQVHCRFPESFLYIVGSQPPLQLQRMASDKVVVTGCVPDITPYLDRAALVVVPLRLGGGMRVKVLEALANGKAIVASPLAAEGLGLENGKQVVLAESDQEFSEAIVNLLDTPGQRAALAEEARAWAGANLNWHKVVGEYEMLYQRLLAVREHG